MKECGRKVAIFTKKLDVIENEAIFDSSK